MRTIELSDDEAGRLHELLSRFAAELAREIAATDSRAFRAALRDDAELLRLLLRALDVVPAAPRP